ncbi:MAG: hypothetical protein B7733_20945 [Myxococcales bacterium FL481]|nr:MAG: hypothetical protein B7733_20945 [Myxococcales bacterium FL481]
MPRPRFVSSLCVVVVGAMACRADPVTAPAVDPTEPARRAAQAFVHCIEQDAAQCVRTSPRDGAWDAFSLLGWLNSGSPTSILAAFGRQLDRHANPREIQRRFVAQVDDYAAMVRGAGCHTQRVAPVAELLPVLREQGQARLERLGLWSPELAEVVVGLTAEADEGLHDGYLVHVACRQAPWSLHLATASESGRYTVVGLMSALPPALRRDAAVSEGSRPTEARQARVDGTVAPLPEGWVHPWLPFAVESY